jgi:uncharacterized protein
MEMDLERIKQLANQRRAENLQFKSWLRQFSAKEIDKYVADLNGAVSSAIDCTQCANCCKLLEPPVNHEEIDKLAAFKETSTYDFVDSYIGIEPSTGVKFLRCQPCIFLNGNVCGVYEQRPISCADYPHLTAPNFKYRWKSVMENYSLCPIVFNVVERLKQELNFTKSE